MPYFHRVDETSFRPTDHVSGAWNTREQHIAPALGLLAHLVEVDRDARGRHDLAVTRLSYDIWGTIPLDVVHTAVRVLRPGRSVELVEAELSHGQRRGLTLRAWLTQAGDTATLAATDLPALPGPDTMDPWDPATVWPGGFIRSVEVRRVALGPGRAGFWVRTDVPLLDGEPVSPLARAAGLIDGSNGLTVRADPREVAFPNVDLTAHAFRAPDDGWLGFDTAVSFGPTGAGLTSSVLHDAGGPWGTSAQSLLVRRL
ncbi:conserved hypothetical protein [Beutenbergia cavernae DSM 12333]|uniref:Thioesterase n=1 Tax=Beutenbergia cavernae (strain ATCC BAA-8 / DSM 12333 / CCUG 43141 / JCM 11478 / NBRC 16432 / NCIMB 13614 / HKI 0122) TaxID=471853 RepID=C5C4Q6_BEUC1|nr:thioesterase family protein [Beutenbergia cavernae]ACQ80034.1 conserved hypothetical protein [Beutenbergia cavernae DSM 12333]